MKRHGLLLLALCGLLAGAYGQQGLRLSGWVRDSLTGKPLAGAHIYLTESGNGVTTSDDGAYKILLDTGHHTLRVSYIGYETKIVPLYLRKPMQKTILLRQKDFEGKEVTVTDRRIRQQVDESQMGKTELHIDAVRQLPAFFGEPDVLKSIQLLPGIQSSGEGNSGFHVRGGGIDQNLILLDRTKLYNVGHLFGFFSVFNADAVQSAEIMKGDIPAEYGGRLSSALNVTTPNGNDKGFRGKVGIGLIYSNLFLEGPVVKEKASFLIAGRRTYIDALIQPFLKEDSPMKGMDFHFYDLNGKLTWKISPKNHLFLNAYNGSDAYQFKTNGGAINSYFQWDNTCASLQWWHFFNAGTTLNTLVSATDYNFYTAMGMDIYEIYARSGIRDYQFRTDWDMEKERYRIHSGAEYTFHHFIPNNYEAYSGSTAMELQEREQLYAHDAALFATANVMLGKRWRAQAGIRTSYFQQTGPYHHYVLNEIGQVTDTLFYPAWSNVKDYFGLEPRISMRFALDSHQSVKAAYNHSYQYVQQVSLSSISLPTDAWMPSTESVLPQSCDQVAVGWFRDFPKQELTASVEAYYKKMHHLTEYKAGYSPYNEAAYGYSDPYTQGDGWSYGVEWFAQKEGGRLRGWLGYTLSWSYRQFEQLNSGEVFCAKNDRRHDVSFMCSYDILPQLTASVVWVYATGNTMTVPVGYYFVGYNLIVEYSGTNAYRMQPYHRMDVSLNWLFRRTQHCEHSLQFSVFNLYNRKNPFFISIQTTMEGDDMSKIALQSQAYQMSLFPILPSLSWNVKFK
ncbi:MAG: TonB-dependent receptor [Bacteroidales bacterium]|nr:TonB-dependent receptor [Bacteroidales bacterium]